MTHTIHTGLVAFVRRSFIHSLAYPSIGDVTGCIGQLADHDSNKPTPGRQPARPSIPLIYTRSFVR